MPALPLESTTPTTTVPVYQIQSQDGPGYDLMNYGTAGYAPYEFVKSIQTGTVTFDNQDAAHQEMIRRYQEMMDQNALPPDAPDLDDLLKGTAASFAAPVGAAIGAQFATSPDLSFGLNLKTGLSEGFKLNPDPLSMALKTKDFSFPVLEAGEVFQPEFYSAATAKRAGVSAEFNALTKDGHLNKGVILESKVNRKDFSLAKGITKDVDLSLIHI